MMCFTNISTRTCSDETSTVGLEDSTDMAERQDKVHIGFEMIVLLKKNLIIYLDRIVL